MEKKKWNNHKDKTWWEEKEELPKKNKYAAEEGWETMKSRYNNRLKNWREIE